MSNCRSKPRPVSAIRRLVGFGLEDSYGKRQENLRELIIYSELDPYQPSSDPKYHQEDGNPARESIPLNIGSVFNGDFYLYGSGNTNAPPSWLDALEFCGFHRESASYEDGVLYKQKQRCKSATAVVNYHNNINILRGIRGKMSFSADAGSAVNCRIDGNGLRAEFEDDIPNFDQEPIDEIVLFEDVGFLLETEDGDEIIPVIKNFSIDTGINLFTRKDGDDTGDITAIEVEYGRRPKWSCAVEYNSLHNWEELFRNKTKFRLQMTLGSNSGSIFKFFTEDFNAKLDNIPPFGNILGMRVKTLDFNILGENGLNVLYK